MIIEGQKCPNVGQMMQKQLQAQQICEALEQKDRIRNKKASYERDKAYLKKLSEQDGEIKQLATKISGLIEKKNTRIRESSISGDAQKLDAELEKIQALRREADEYMKKPDVAALNVNVNLEPDLDLDYIKKNISV
jgi:chromosome segregation ATPase